MPFCYFNEKVGEHAVINCPLKTKLQQMESLHFENRGTIYSYFDFSLKQQFSVALPTP